jgi:uncharacterized protein YjbI with pentapeptide repeats
VGAANVRHFGKSRKTWNPPAESFKTLTYLRNLEHMSSNALSNLVQKGNTKKFHRAVQKHEEEHGDLPTLEMASFKGVDLAGFDFSGIDLSNVAFEECTLTECRFDGCLLDGIYLHSCTLLNCHFEQAHGEGVALDASTLSRCEFRDCAFEFPEWTDSQFNDCILENLDGPDFNFERVTFKGGVWREIHPDSGEMRFVTLREMSIEDVDLSKCESASCYLNAVNATNSRLPDGFVEKTGRRRVI